MDKKRKVYSREGYLREHYHYFHLRDCAGQERDFHYHEFDKLVLLLSGRVDYAVEDSLYTLRPWSVLLVKHHTIHRASIDRSVPYERIILYLDRQYFERCLPEAGLMDCFEAADRSGRCLLQPNETQRRALQQLIDSYESSAADRDFGAQALRDTLVMQMLIQVSRMGVGLAPAERTEDPKMRRVLSYINDNLSGELTVEALAEQVYLSRYHFMRLFKAQTGSTVHAYVRQKRLLTAARLIREGVPAVQAAAESGFGDYSAFHRAFKASFGVSPGKIKEQNGPVQVPKR